MKSVALSLVNSSATTFRPFCCAVALKTEATPWP